MDSRKLQRTASHVRKEGMGEHPLQWLRADMWADYRRVAPADYNSEMSEAELQHMIKNARETWARAHKDWTPEGDGEIAPHACSERAQPDYHRRARVAWCVPPSPPSRCSQACGCAAQPSFKPVGSQHGQRCHQRAPRPARSRRLTSATARANKPASQARTMTCLDQSRTAQRSPSLAPRKVSAS
jgi:hypothetical protein